LIIDVPLTLAVLYQVFPPFFFAVSDFSQLLLYPFSFFLPHSLVAGFQEVRLFFLVVPASNPPLGFVSAGPLARDSFVLSPSLFVSFSDLLWPVPLGVLHLPKS